MNKHATMNNSFKLTQNKTERKQKKMKIKKRAIKKKQKEGFSAEEWEEVKMEKKQFSINERKRTENLQAR